MDGKLNKKLILIIVKYGSWIIGLFYLIQLILSCFGLYFVGLGIIFGASVFPLTLLCLFSYFLGFCIWNRLPLYYVLLCNFINIIDFYIGIPIPNIWMLVCYLILLGIFITVGAYVKNKKNVRKRNLKENSS